MSAHQAEFPITTMARVLRVSVSGYYAWRSRPISTHATSDAALLRRIRTIHAASYATYGAPRVHAEPQAEGMAVGRKRVARLMRRVGLRGVSRRRSQRRRSASRTIGPSTIWLAAIFGPQARTGSGWPTCLAPSARRVGSRSAASAGQ
jgi:putative transposase